MREDWVRIETYGKAKQTWLSTFLELPNRIPSQDTFARVIGKLDPEMLEKNFQNRRSVAGATEPLGLNFC